MIFLRGIVDLPLQVALISGVPPSFHYGGQEARNLPSSLTLLPSFRAQRETLYLQCYQRSEEACISCSVAVRNNSAAGSFVFERGGL